MEIKQAKLSFVTDDELIRGFDYRNNTLGFYLLLLNPFIHDRDYEQCIGTVARYYEPRKLFIDPSVPAVNQTKKETVLHVWNRAVNLDWRINLHGIIEPENKSSKRVIFSRLKNGEKNNFMLCLCLKTYLTGFSSR